MITIPQVATAMQTVLTSLADQAGRASDFIVRQTKLTGSAFVQTLVFGFLANPDATVEQLAHTAAIAGVSLSPQAIDQRFTPTAAACLEHVLTDAMRMVQVASTPLASPILERFVRVVVEDTTTITLPAALADVWFGCGAHRAALKLHVGLDLRTGALQGLSLHDGCAAENEAAPLALPPGSLWLADLGFFDLSYLATLSQRGVSWLLRYKTGTVIWGADGQRWDDVVAQLDTFGTDRVEQEVQLGTDRRVTARLLAVRVPQEVVDARRRRRYAQAKRHGRTPSAAALALAAWTILITNVPPSLLTLDEALVVAKVRWQIELLFKLWKSHGQVDAWRSQNPWRILCEVYAKLLGMLVLHWVLVLCCWQYADRSLTKAAQMVQHHAWTLARSLRDHPQLVAILQDLQHWLSHGCRINKGNKRKHTYQLLMDVADDSLA